MLTLCLAGLVFFFFGGGEMSMVYWKVWLSPRSVPATADAVVELPGGRLVVHVHVHLPRDPLTLG